MHVKLRLSELPTLNKYINADRQNKKVGRKIVFSGGNKLKSDTETKIVWQCKQQHLKLPKEPLYIAIEWYNYNLEDSDNVEFAQKFIYDALQKGGFLKNDSKKFIMGKKYHEHRKDKSTKEKFCIVNFFTQKPDFKQYINYLVDLD